MPFRIAIFNFQLAKYSWYTKNIATKLYTLNNEENKYLETGSYSGNKKGFR
jgi:hypothetical protein